MTLEGRIEATRLVKQRIQEGVDLERQKKTPLTSADEVVKVMSPEEFKSKDWSKEVPNKKMRTDVEKRVQELAIEDQKIIDDTGNFESGGEKSNLYNNSKNIVRHFIQNVFPKQIGKTVRKGALVKGVKTKISRLNNFAKWMAEQNKEIKDVTNEDFGVYLSQNSTHVTELQQLREFLQTNQLAKRTFNLTLGDTQALAQKYLGDAPEGITTDAHNIGKNSITYVQPKSNKSITKYISGKLKSILNVLSKKNKQENPDVNQLFLTKDSKLISNEVLNKFVDTVFGEKGLKDKARLFRDSLTGWASEKYGSTSAKVEVLIQEVLGDEANASVINKAYVNKEAQKTVATKLVKQFLAEINKGGKKAKGKNFYSTKEIAKGLKKLTGKKDVIVSIQVGTKNKKPVFKDVVIDGLTAQGIGKYLIETSPRINEVVPSTEAKSTKYQLESAANRLGVEVQDLKAQIDYFKKKYPELDINLKKDLGKFQGEYVLGRITGHLIEVVEGRANIDTIPHEVSHHVVDVLRAFGDKSSKKLIRDGERMFKDVDRSKSPDENMVQAIGEYVAGRMTNKTMMGKVKSFITRFVSHLKNKLNIHNKSDVTRILGEKVLKGDLPETQRKDFVVKYQTSKDSPEAKSQIEKINKDIHKGSNLDKTVKNSDPKGWKDARLKIFGTTKYKIKDISLDQIEKYQEFLVNHKANGGTTKPSSEPIVRRIEEVNEKYHVNPIIAKAKLELMGVKDGLYENASETTMKEYESLTRNEYDTPALKDTNYSDTNMLADPTSKETSKLDKFMFTYGRFAMPTWLVLRKFGGESGRRISDRMLNHEVAEHVDFKGPGDKAIFLVRKTLGYSKSKDAVLIFDKERADRMYNNGKMSKKQKDFYEKVYGDKDGKGIDKNSDEYRAGEVWNTYTKDIYSKLEKALSMHETPEGVRRIMKELEDIKVNNYMTRSLTKKALKYYIDPKNDYITSLVDKSVKAAAKRQAKSEGKTDKDVERIEKAYLDETTEKGQIFREDIKTEIYNVLKYGYGSVKNPNLIPRKGLLPEQMEITNDKGQLETIDVYENSIEATAEMYVRRMSKHLANLTYFPEFLNAGSRYNIDKGSKADIVSQSKQKELATYSNLAIERQLGIDYNAKQLLARPLYKIGGAVSSMSAAVGLSSPFSGIKNLAIGIPRSMSIHGVGKTIKAMGTIFDVQKWDEARASGSLEYGAKTLELGDQSLGWEKFNMRNLFKFNAMTFTENLNRIISSNAGLAYFAETIPVLRGEKGSFKMGTNKKRMKTLMEELWHLTDDEISFLEKQDYTSHESKGQYSQILKKVGHFSHVSAQGGTSTVILPLWMSSKEAKPFTLFQRMAMSTTIDMYRNVIKPIAQYGNFAPLLRATAAHAFTGAALYYFYEEAFGKTAPKGTKLAQSDPMNKLLLNLWRSEFFGLAGEVLPISPYSKEASIPFSEPIIVRNIISSGENMYAVYNKKKSISQAVKDFVRQTVVVGAQVESAFYNNVSPYASEFNSMRKMVNKFKEERGMERYSGEGDMSRRQPYYRSLKNSMMFGKEEEIAQKYWAAIAFVVTDIERTNPYMKPRARYKKAIKSVKNVVTHYAPLNISDKKKGTSKTLRNQFLDWLDPENKQLAIKLEKMHKYQHRKMLKIMRKSKYKKKYFVYHGVS